MEAQTRDTKLKATTRDEKKPRRDGKTQLVVAAVCVLLLFGVTRLLGAFVLPTGSMEDTLLIGDHFLVQKLFYGEPKHGDIIAFRYPGDLTMIFVKRVIGVPGDHLKMVQREVYRNGEKLHEPYVVHKDPNDVDSRDNFPGDPSPYLLSTPLAAELQRKMLTENVVNGEIVVPKGNYFTMGDNRDNSLGSQYWGFVPRENVIGKPVLVYWSYQSRTEDFAGSDARSRIARVRDMEVHFSDRTRWSRSFMRIRGFPDSELPKHEIPVNRGVQNP